jgi:multisubunit Na+/H+ antiporter MnhG subunit
MKFYRRMHGIRQFVTVGLLGTTLAFGGCQLGDFTATSTVTLSGREVVSFLVRSWIMTPLQTAIDNAVNEFFDQIEEDND